MKDFWVDCEKFLKDVYKVKGRLSAEKYNQLAAKVFVIWLTFTVCDLVTLNFLEYHPEYILLNSMHLAIKILYMGLSWVGMICIVIRRQHDRDRSGWRILIPIIIGLMTNLLLVWLLYTYILSTREGTDGKNKYGDKPTDD